MRKALAGWACVAGLAVTAPIAAQSGNVQVRVTGRLHVQYNTTSVSEEDLGGTAALASSTFETRRVRIAANLSIDDWITGLIEPDFALARLQLKNAWMNLGIDPAFQLRIGQFKKPFSRVQLTSSLDYTAIERGLRIRDLADAYSIVDGAAASPVLGSFRGETILGEEQELLDQFGYMAHELGAAVHGTIGEFEYEAGLFNGTGPDRRDENDAKSLAGRLVWNAPTEIPLSFGAGVSYHEIRAGSEAAVPDGTAFEVDFELGAFRSEGIHVIGEAVSGKNLGADETFVAAQGVFSYFRPTSGRVAGIEPLVRLSWGDPNREIADDAGLLVTPGINLHFLGRNRLMVNWDVFVPQGDRFDTQHGLRAQAQMVF